jgi:nucleotide-binding universal stress UspA family protein
MFKRILVPVDGSDPSRRAVQTAGELAKALGAEVRVMHITSRGRGSRVLITPEATTFRWESPDESTALVSEAAERLREQGVAVTTEVPDKFEAIGEEIVDAARSYDGDLIVMGSAGRGAVGAAVLGSVAQSVIHQSPIPVVVVR